MNMNITIVVSLTGELQRLVSQAVFEQDPPETSRTICMLLWFPSSKCQGN